MLRAAINNVRTHNDRYGGKLRSVRHRRRSLSKWKPHIHMIGGMRNHVHGKTQYRMSGSVSLT
jgi:hypothetical protein